MHAPLIVVVPDISIHVPLAGNVLRRLGSGVSVAEFLSTFPLRGTSHLTPHVGTDSFISIHVPLAGNVAGLTGRY